MDISVDMRTEIGEPYIETSVGRGQHPVMVVRLMVPAESHYWIGHSDAQTQPIDEQLLRDDLTAQGVANPIVWLYTPMASLFVAAPQPRLLIYDVMDELSAFKGAPAGRCRTAQRFGCRSRRRGRRG